MHPMFLFGTPEVIVVLLIAALVIFGGSRLAGVGKGAGQAIREFKEETEGLNKPKQIDAVPTQPGQADYPVAQQSQQVITPQQPPAPQYQQTQTAYQPVQQAQPTQQSYQPVQQAQPSYQQSAQQPYQPNAQQPSAVQPASQYPTTSDSALAPDDERA